MIKISKKESSCCKWGEGLGDLTIKKFGIRERMKDRIKMTAFLKIPIEKIKYAELIKLIY